MHAARLRDVAERANVSMTTASYVLRHSPAARISLETRERVLAVAAEIGYRPRAQRRVPSVVGLRLDSGCESVAREFLTGLAEGASTRDILMALTPDGDVPIENALDSFRVPASRFGGLIRLGPAASAAHDRPFWTVVVDAVSGPTEPVDGHAVVTPDDRRAASEIGQELARSGRRRVVVVAGEGEAGLAARWAEGLGAVLAQAPASVSVDAHPQGAADGLDAHLRDADQPALVCMSPRSARLAAQAAAAAGLTRPGDLAVVVRGDGFDSGPLAAGDVRWLDLPFGEMGRAAIAALPDSARELRRDQQRRANPVLTAPAGVDLVALRDHCVWRVGDEWRQLWARACAPGAAPRSSSSRGTCTSGDTWGRSSSRSGTSPRSAGPSEAPTGTASSGSAWTCSGSAGRDLGSGRVGRRRRRDGRPRLLGLLGVPHGDVPHPVPDGHLPGHDVRAERAAPVRPRGGPGPRPGARAEVVVRASGDARERTVVEVDRGGAPGEGWLRLDRTASSLDPGAGSTERSGPVPVGDDGRVRLRILLDHSVLEVFANGRALTARVYPTLPDADRAALTVPPASGADDGGPGVRVERFDGWRMADAWPGRAPRRL